jgi:hypothetical protein
MKQILIFVTIVGVLTTTASSFDDPEPPPVPAPPGEPAPFRAPIPPSPPRDILFAHESLAEAEAMIEDVVEQHGNPLGRAMSMINLSRRNSLGDRSLVVPGNQVDTEERREMQEDLNIMGRLLEKLTSPKYQDAESFQAMGIKLQSLSGSAGAPRNIYLDGYGALFFLRVKLPLVGPPQKEDDEDTTAEEPVSSAWEEARADVYGERRQRAFGRGGREEFDENKVEHLKESLMEALKNATHMRHLKANETVTIMVAGDGGRLVEGARRVRAGFGGPNAPRVDVFKYVEPGRPGSAAGGSTLLLRVTKSDVDAFANDKLTSEEFRKKVTTLAY